METGLERIAAKARCEPKLRFTSLAHHITKERVWKSLCQIPATSAAGVDGRGYRRRRRASRDGLSGCCNPSTARDIGRPIFGGSISRSPESRRSALWGCHCSGPGTPAKRVSGTSAIYEQDFLPCSFGGRPGGCPSRAGDPHRGSPAAKSGGCWRRTSRTSSMPHQTTPGFLVRPRRGHL